MAGDEGTQASEERSRGIGDQLISALMQALPALVGAVGFVGFVAVLGAAIDWVRFQSAGLPAEQAVRVIARPELVATGAVSLIAFTLLGLFAVLVVYMLDPRAAATPRLRRGLAAIALVELLTPLLFVRALWWVYPVVAAGAVAFAVLAARLHGKAGNWFAGRVAVRSLPERLEATRHGLVEADRDVRALRAAHAKNGLRWFLGTERAAMLDAERRLALAGFTMEALLDEAGRHLQEAGRTAEAQDATSEPRFPDGSVGALAGRAERAAGAIAPLAQSSVGVWHAEVRDVAPGLGMALAMVALLAGAATAILSLPHVRWLGVMLIVVVLLNGALYGIAFASRRFRWYGVAVFLSIPLFGAILGVERTAHLPKLQPVALIRKSSDRAVCGLYIAETSDRVYIGRVELSNERKHRVVHGSGRIFWIPESDVDMIKIGSSQPIPDANGRAPLLARELYGDRIEAPPATVRPTTTVVQRTPSRRLTTTTTSERAARRSAPAVKRMPKSPPETCTHVSLAKPIKERGKRSVRGS